MILGIKTNNKTNNNHSYYIDYHRPDKQKHKNHIDYHRPDKQKHKNSLEKGHQISTFLLFLTSIRYIVYYSLSRDLFYRTGIRDMTPVYKRLINMVYAV